MRRIKSQKKKQEEVKFFDKKSNIIKTAVVGLALLIIIFILMLLESGEGKTTVKNDTDLKLEYVKAYFVDAEGALDEGLSFSSIDAGSTVSNITGNHYLYGQGANLEVRFKFEGHEELFVDAGIFNDNFSEDIKIAFKQLNQDDIKLTVKAKSGIFTSNLINCDEEYTVKLSEGYVAE